MNEKVTMDEVINSLKDQIIGTLGYSAGETRALMEALRIAYSIEEDFEKEEDGEDI